MKAEYKIFLATFSFIFVALFIIHLAWLPYYWANASPQDKPIDLYSPSAWTPAIIFYSVLVAVIPVVAFSLLSRLRKSKASETIIFVTVFCLGWVVFWVLFALGPLQFGHTIRLYSYWDLDSKTGYANFLATFLFSFVGAVLSVVFFELNKLLR